MVFAQCPYCYDGEVCRVLDDYFCNKCKREVKIKGGMSD